jgi:hypothetical protein
LIDISGYFRRICILRNALFPDPANPIDYPLLGYLFRFDAGFVSLFTESVSGDLTGW